MVSVSDYGIGGLQGYTVHIGLIAANINGSDEDHYTVFRCPGYEAKPGHG